MRKTDAFADTCPFKHHTKDKMAHHAAATTAGLRPPWSGAYRGRMTATSKRLDRQDWLTTGFTALAEAGPDTLKAEPLARKLGTTKGSFYWHFKDVPDYHAALLAAWEDQDQSSAQAQLEREATPVSKLRALAQNIADPKHNLAVEPAIRAWATGHAQAAQAIARVDAQRLSLAQTLLAETGIGNPEMARIICAAAVGMASMGENHRDDNRAAIGSLVDLVLALR